MFWWCAAAAKAVVVACCFPFLNLVPAQSLSRTRTLFSKAKAWQRRKNQFFTGNRLAAHTLAVIERCECACGSAANATTLAKLSLPLASLAKLARCIARS
ncbi:hypothetical protein Tsp_03668 [Trichinella spiralis]|uniref:hypothetical protein n=1 Tax=Trichinella spiralis TaxID=6334 RepID=UPI0001EFB744|nr:hypothetical protein Tsp_03668 [Trichinella spiralis]